MNSPDGKLKNEATHFLMQLSQTNIETQPKVLAIPSQVVSTSTTLSQPSLYGLALGAVEAAYLCHI